VKHSLKFDVAVIGGGPGGIPAALAAARRGAKVILVERNGHLGGNLVMGLPLLGYLDQNGRQIIGGIAQEFIDDMMAAGHSSPGLRGSRVGPGLAFTPLLAFLPRTRTRRAKSSCT